jgi:hypothetical protein
MKNIFVIIACALCLLDVSAQNINAIINAKEVERIESVLSADNMAGRMTGTDGADKAAQFIAAEYKASGLKPRQRVFAEF